MGVSSWSEGYLSKGTNIYTLDSASVTDDGTNISYRAKLYAHLPGESNEKQLWNLWAKAKQYHDYTSSADFIVTVDRVILDPISVDFDLSMVWGKSTWGYSEWGFYDVVTIKEEADGQGINIEIDIQNNKAEPVEIYSLILQYKPKRMR